MSLAAPSPPTALLRDVVRRARPFHERIAAFRAHPWPAPQAGCPEAARRLEAWRKTVVNGDAQAFALRLAWDGLDESSALALLSDAHAPDDDGPFPAWAAAFAAVYALDDPSADPIDPHPADRALAADDPLPFEAAFLPLVRWARARVAHESADAYGLLSDAAHAALERGLLRRVTDAGARALVLRMAAKRAMRGSFGALVGGDSGGLYESTVDDLRRGGMARLAAQFPVLARLLGTATTLWIDTVREFLSRLAADRGEIARVLAGGRDPGRVTAVRCDAADFHCGGRSVFLLTFESGLRAVYKPRTLALEPAFAEMARWMAARGGPSLRTPALIAREGYGWIEFVEGGACADESAVRRFYARCGALLAMAHALGGTDFHYENLLAAGEHPVLIDLETMLSHRFDLVEKVPNQGFGAEAVRAALQTSVVGVQMLPRLKVTAAGVAANTGALANEAPPAGELQAEVVGWLDVNTDQMRQGRRRVTLPPMGGHMALLDGRRVPAGEHVDALAEGFAAAYRLLAKGRDSLLAENGPVSRLRGAPVRFILHHTSLYATLLERCLNPAHLADGVARGIQIDALCRPLVSLGEKPAVWGALRAEHADLERMDVPLFAPPSDTTALPLADGTSLPDVFARDAFSEAVRRIEGLDEAGLAAQLDLVHATFRADLARTPAAHAVVHPATAATDSAASVDQVDEVPGRGGFGGSTGSADGVVGSTTRVEFGDSTGSADAVDGSPTRVGFGGSSESADDDVAALALDEARAIAAALERRAIRGADGSIGWISAGYVPRARRWEVAAGAANLFDGYVGTAFFLAALHRIDPDAGHGHLARAALRPLTTRVRDYATMFRLRKDRDLGAGTGLGSLLYALPRLATWLGDEEMRDAARTLSTLLDGDAEIAADRCDLLSGAAGAIPGLLSLHATGDADALARAAALGRSILAARREEPASGLRVWTGPDGRVEIGLAHGQSGIVLALHRLAAATSDDAFAAGAREASAFERERMAAAPERFAAWSAGFTGIALARLSDADARDEVESAVASIRATLMDGADAATAGALGRMELLLSAGAALARPEWIADARMIAHQAIARARSGGWRTGWEPFAHPGLFAGMAGIGYQLLRAAHPDELPAVLAWG